jgi:hypothetical protein
MSAFYVITSLLYKIFNVDDEAGLHVNMFDKSKTLSDNKLKDYKVNV